MNSEPPRNNAVCMQHKKTSHALFMEPGMEMDRRPDILPTKNLSPDLPAFLCAQHISIISKLFSYENTHCSWEFPLNTQNL